MKSSTRNWIIIGAVGAAGLVAWYIIKGRGSKQSSTDLASQGIDPATGVPFAQEYGGYGAAGGAGTPSLYGYYDPNTGQFISGAGAGGSGGFVLAPSTNAEWAQQAEAYLTGIGYDAMTVAAALGKYLTGQTITSDQAGIVAAAKGFFGTPPQPFTPGPVTNPGGQGSGGGGNTFTPTKSGTLADLFADERWSQAIQQQILSLNPTLKPTSVVKAGTPINVPSTGFTP